MAAQFLGCWWMMPLCTRTKQTQASVLQASQTHPQRVFTPTQPSYLAAPGTAQWARHTWLHWGAWSNLCTSLFPLPLLQCTPNKGAFSLPPKWERCKSSPPPAAAPRGALRCSDLGFSSFRPLLDFTLSELFFWNEDLQPPLDPALRTPGLLCSHRYWPSSVLNADHLGLKLRPGSSNGYTARNKTNPTDPRFSSLKKQQHKHMFAK